MLATKATALNAGDYGEQAVLKVLGKGKEVYLERA